jgi:two-component system, response regulator RegA
MTPHPLPEDANDDAGAAAPSAPGAAAASGQDATDADAPAADRLLIIVEDDETFARTLGRSFERRGYRVLHATGLEGLQALLPDHRPDYAVIDLKLKGEASGLACVQALHEHHPQTIIVVLTGYASIATAVEAIKLGARHYLAKPSNTDDIEQAFGRDAGDIETELSDRPTSIKTLEWERIHETLAETGFNISETARRLGMHRRTLARKLEKQRVK